MNQIHNRKELFAKSIRKEEREQIFNKIRLQLIANNQINFMQQTNYQSAFEGQQQILQSIINYKQENQPLNFKAINHYICQFNKTFTQEFIAQIIKLVLDQFKNNAYAIACLANLLYKVPNNGDLLQNFKMRQLIQQIIELNLQTNNNDSHIHLKNAKVITFLMFNLMRHATSISQMNIITKYYKYMVDQLGIYDILIILMFSQASYYRQLLPQKNIIVMYFINQINYENISELMLYRICELLQNYIRYDQDTSLYHLFSDWIEKRLRQRKFPNKLKINLIKLITMMINACRNHTFSMELANLKVFKEIIMLCRFEQIEIKVCSLQCIISLIESLNLTNDSSSFYEFLQQNHIIEILVYSFDLNLEVNCKFRVLTCLCYIFIQNESYVLPLIKKAHNFGLMKHLYKFTKIEGNKKLGQLAAFIEQIYQKHVNHDYK